MRILAIKIINGNKNMKSHNDNSSDSSNHNNNSNKDQKTDGIGCQDTGVQSWIPLQGGLRHVA